MYAQVGKSNEYKSQAVANETVQKKGDSESTFQFVDNRPEAIAQKKIIGVINNQTTGKYPIQSKRPSIGKWDERTTNIYNASGGKENRYIGGRPAKFSKTVKNKLINAWAQMGFVYRNQYGIFIRPASGGQPLPPDAIQIDHKTSWDTYEKDLKNSNNTQKHLNVLKDLPQVAYSKDKNSFSIWAARMYYHDFENLVPENPSKNASKGSGVTDDVIYSGTPSEEINMNLSLLHSMSERAEQLRSVWATQDMNGTLSEEQIDNINSHLVTLNQEFVKLEEYTKTF